MAYGWSDTSTLGISNRAPDQATLGGETITNIRPNMRESFKEFVEDHAVSLNPTENTDDFFARFDEALDTVDAKFRIRHGIFFTDLCLSRFVMWLVKQDIPDLGKNYLVIDPACGSGNLVTNWRSPLELRHKVVSEIEPELLFAVEKRMKGDQWHNGKYTVVPKVSENKGLNFLDRSAKDYLLEVKKYLTEKNHRADKPLAFLCNPPYRGDDDQKAGGAGYKPHESILDVVGADASKERYCCFLAQMKLVCEAAESSGLPGDSRLLLFTKSAWLTRRSTFDGIRTSILGSFQDSGGILVNGKEFFDVRGTWPVAFTLWQHKGKDATLDPHRGIPLIDLTWLKKERLTEIPWDTPKAMDRACREILNDQKSVRVSVGTDRISIRQWSGKTMTDFKRDRRKDEQDKRLVGGLPLGDRRHKAKKAHGEAQGEFIGFMDDLTPCRVKKSEADRPWFRLNSQFMDVKKNRCFSGPPTHLGYCASDLESAKKLFFWYSLAKTFLQCSYPMWVDADDMWAPAIPKKLEGSVFSTAFAIGYADNECVEALFPANNPCPGARELTINNPMTSLSSASFWSLTMRPFFETNASSEPRALVNAVDELFQEWKKLLRGRIEVPISRRTYMLDDRGLTIGAGVLQIADYARETDSKDLLARLTQIQELLKLVKANLFRMIEAKTSLDYWSPPKNSLPHKIRLPDKTKFDRVLSKRLAVAGVLVKASSEDVNFGRTKFSKLFYLCDIHDGLSLDAEYYREAAGPLDPRALYNDRIGIESLARKYDIFSPEAHGKMIRYRQGNSSVNS